MDGSKRGIRTFRMTPKLTILNMKTYLTSSPEPLGMTKSMYSSILSKSPTASRPDTIEMASAHPYWDKALWTIG